MAEKVYLAGPMTGIKAFNFPAFHKAQETLEAAGYAVVSPADLDDPAQRRAAESSADGDLKDYEATTGMTWADFLARDIKLITDEVDAVVLLPGWETSKGARLEKFIAELTHKHVYDYERWNKAGALPILSTHEIRVTSATGGQKGRKPQRTDLIPPEFLLALSEVYGMGAEKYDDHNYLKGYDWSLSFGALLRHVYSAQSGEWLDDESGLPHVLHAAWHCACLFMFEKHDLGTDDRLNSTVAGLR